MARTRFPMQDSLISAGLSVQDLPIGEWTGRVTFHANRNQFCNAGLNGRMPQILFIIDQAKFQLFFSFAPSNACHRAVFMVLNDDRKERRDGICR
jgi:hypothetical protein